jgi:hypothetical protein
MPKLRASKASFGGTRTHGSMRFGILDARDMARGTVRPVRYISGVSTGVFARSRSFSHLYTSPSSTLPPCHLPTINTKDNDIHPILQLHARLCIKPLLYSVSEPMTAPFISQHTDVYPSTALAIFKAALHPRLPFRISDQVLSKSTHHKP